MKVITQSKVETERSCEAGISLMVLVHALDSCWVYLYYNINQSLLLVWQTDKSEVVRNELPEDFTSDVFPYQIHIKEKVMI